jgi:hypothetical protein
MTDLMEQTDLEAALDEWLAGALDEADGPPQDQDGADRLLGALRVVERREADITALVRARVESLMAWKNQQLEQLGGRRRWLEGQLEAWTRAQHSEIGRQTWKVPNGTLALRQRQVKVELDDSYAKDPVVIDRYVDLLGPGVVKTERSIRAGEAKAMVEPGEIIAGATAPDGYEARQAITGDDEHGWQVLPGMVLLIPTQLGFKATPSGLA